MSNDYTTKQVSTNIYQPTAALPIKNSGISQTALAIDSNTGTRLLTIDSGGNGTLYNQFKCAFIGMNTTSSLVDALGIKCQSSTTNIITGRNTSGTPVFSVDNSGNLKLGGSISGNLSISPM